MPIGIPMWMIIVALLAGLAAAILSYFRNKKQRCQRQHFADFSGMSNNS